MEESSNVETAAPDDEITVKVNASRTQRSLRGEKVHLAADDHLRDEEDEDYWSRMVNEVADPSNDDEPAAKARRVHDDSPRVPSVFDRVSQLEDENTQMERDLEYFPFRDPGDRCAGLQTTMRCAFCDAEGEHFRTRASCFGMAMNASTSYAPKDGVRFASEIARGTSRVAYENGNAGIALASRTPFSLT
ncbi:hypothetical protein RB195_005906 [Necator americanus]|uniref:Uncharacterized protein n=1 Tax=Necator americanus TaxID=51031 RepID=A0ABR1BQ55_NECAM